MVEPTSDTRPAGSDTDRPPTVSPPASSDGHVCAGCGGALGSGSAAYVYAVGRIEPRFPSLSVEKEFAQAVGRTETTGKTDPEAFHAVLSRRENHYLLRQLCWVLNTQGIETYLLLPRDAVGVEALLEAIRPRPGPMDIDVIIGLRGPVAPPSLCNGLTVPVVAFDQIYSFDRGALIEAIPRPEKAGPAERFDAAAEEVFDTILQMADNAGATDEHRALNYLAMRYPAVYAKAAEEFGRDFALTAVEARPAALAGARRLVDAIFSFASRKTDFTEKFAARVDVTGEFPFLVTKLSPCYDR